MNEKKRNLHISHFIPFFAMMAAAVITVICYTFTAEKREFMDYLAVIGVAMVPLLFPLYTLLFGRTLPPFVCIMICVHMFVSANLGTAFKLYDVFLWWDLFAHGLFGFNACIAAFVIARDFGEIRSMWGGLLLAMFVAMGLAAMWEMMKYICDRITGGDTQRVAESVVAGKSPLADTIEDITITLAGWLVFAVLFLTDNLCAHKIFRKLGLVSPSVREEDADSENRE